MSKRFAAAALAAIMVMACVVPALAQDDSDAVAPDIPTDTPMGFGGQLTSTEVIGLVLGLIADEAGEDVDIPTSEDELKQYLIDYFAEFGITVNDISFQGSGEIWYLTEVNEHPSGYIMATDAAVNAGVSFTVDAANSAGTRVVLDDLRADIYIVYGSTAVYNSDMDVYGLTMDLGAAIAFNGSTNLGFSPLEGITIGDEVRELEGLSFTTSISGEVNATDGIQILPRSGQTSWTVSTPASLKLTSAISAAIPGTDGYSFMHATEVGTDLDIGLKCETRDGVQHIYLDGEDAFGLLGFSEAEWLPEIRNVPDIPLYTYPFDAMFDSVPSGVKGDSLALSGSDRDRIRSGLDDLMSEYARDVDHPQPNVRLIDPTSILTDPDKVWRTIEAEYGEPVDLPDAEPPRDNLEFVGWSTGTCIWQDDWEVTGSVLLYPVFANTVTGDKVGFFDQLLYDNIVWETEGDKTIDADLINKLDSIQVTVTDGDGNVLYTWDMSNIGGLDISRSKISTKITEVLAPEAIASQFEGLGLMYLDFDASGTMPLSKIKYKLDGQFSDGQDVSVYHVNGDRLEYAGTAEISDGYAEFDIVTCSDYVLVGGAAQAGGESDVMFIVIAVIAVLVVAAVAVVIVKKGRRTA